MMKSIFGSFSVGTVGRQVQMSVQTSRRTSASRATALLPSGPRVQSLIDVVLVLLVAASTARYVIGHGLGGHAPAVLVGASALVVCYLARRVVSADYRTVWLAVVCLLWTVLVLLAASFAWCAVALAFAALRALPFRVATAVVVGLVGLVSLTWARMIDRFDPTVILGPTCLAVLAVGAYRGLEREASARQALLDDLHRTRDELAAAQRREGALAERHRLSREIHDSVAQDLSSINLLLQAAEQDWDTRPDAVRTSLRQAAVTARDGLEEARRVVRDLAPTALDGGSLPDALRRIGTETTTGTGISVRVEVSGPPQPVAADVEAALVRTARGALANVVEHAGARTAVVTLTYLPDQVCLDVIDDGRGLPDDGAAADPGASSAGDPPGNRGRGLRGIRDRVEALGGQVDLESAPGRGTALAVTLPPGGIGQ
jgi:signal transduction histidine kinase